MKPEPPAKKRPEALQQLLDNGFAARVKRFRETGRALSLTEVPKVLDQLLNLRSTELRLLLGEMGLNYRALLRNCKLPHGPTTAEQMIRALSGGLTGTGELLPTTSKEARREAELLFARAAAVRGAEAERLVQRADRLMEVSKEIASLKRLPWFQKIGAYGQVGFHMRMFQAPTLDKDGLPNPKAEQGGWVKLSRDHGKEDSGQLFDLSKLDLLDRHPKVAERLNKMVGAQMTSTLGAQVSEVDRQTGRRKVSPYVSEVFKTTFSSVGYIASRDRKGPTLKTGYQSVQFGYDPIFGTNLRLVRNWFGALFISERYVGIGRFVPGPQGKWEKGLPFPGVSYMRIPVSFAVGMGGDVVEHLTGPFLRFLEDQLDRVQVLRARLGKFRKNKRAERAQDARRPPANPMRTLGFDVREMPDNAPALPISLSALKSPGEATWAKE